MMQTATAQQRKENGQQLALWKAGDEWSKQALDYLRRYLELRADDGHHLFTFEQFRMFAERDGLPMPMSINAWGAFTKTAFNSGLCVPTDQYIKATRPESHARVIRVWRIA